MGVDIQAPPPDGYEGELDFDDTAWASAREQFKANRRAQKKRADTELALDEFLQQHCSPQDARKYIIDAQNERPQYSPGLGGILSKMDAAMKVGDLAIKSAPESIGLAWAGIRMCLHSVQDDFATFSQFSDACVDMIGILINCTVYGGMYGKQHAATCLREIHSQVVSFIPNIYANMLDFNYSMRKHTNQIKIFRIATGLYKSAAAKYKGKFDALKADEKKMRTFAATAAQQLTKYYQEMGLQNDAKQMQNDMKILGDLSDIKDALATGFSEMKDIILQEFKSIKKETPFVVAMKTFESNAVILDPSMDHQNAAYQEKIKREPGTCQWIFKEEEYREWRTSEKSSVLWISGGPGFGKSFLTGSVIETLKQSEKQNDSLAVQFFFCKSGNDATQKSERIMRTLIYQLYVLAKNNEDILEEANRLVTPLARKIQKDKPDKGNKAPGSQSASEKKTTTQVETFQSLVRLLNKTVFLIVDALDEIEDREEESFLEDFLNISRTGDIQVKILFCSRPKSDIQAALSAITTIEVAGHNEDDIRRNVTTLISKLSGFSASERTLACNNIVGKAKGEFRYVEMAMDFLRIPWSRPLENRLEKLQSGLPASYDHALQQTDPNYLDLLQTCLTWTLLSEGNVTVDEVMDAFRGTYGEGQDEQDIEDVVDDKLPRKQIEKAGSVFLEVNSQTGVIKPRHLTVTEHFLRSPTEEAENTELETDNICEICKKAKHSKLRPFTITKKHGHLEIATTILQNLSSDAFWRKHYPEEFWKEYFPEPDPPAVTEDEIGENKPSESAADVESISPAGSKGVDVQDPVPDVNREGEGKICANESEPAVSSLPATPEIPNGLDGLNGTPIIIYKPVDGTDVKVDIEIVAEGDPADEVTTVIASLSVTEGDAAVPSEIVNSDPSTIPNNAADAQDSPPSPGEDDLSDTDSDISLEQENWDWNPKNAPHKRYEVSHCIYHLQRVEEAWPIEERQDPLFNRFQSLLKGFFNKDSPHFQKWSKVQTKNPDSFFYWDEPKNIQPLLVGAVYGLPEILRIFINTEDGTKPDSSEMNKALREASTFYYGDELAHFQILLENDADPNSSGDDVGVLTPFQLLVLNSHKINTVKLFLKHGAKTDLLNSYGWGPFHYFGFSGEDENLDVLNVLLETGADINVKDGEGETPLHKLVSRRNPPLVLLREFIARGAKVNEDDKESQRPLYEVSIEGNVEAATILLDAGADVHHADEHGTTALHKAAQGGHTKTCQLLIEHGADMTKLDKRNRSPFLLACGSRNAETALYLATQLKEHDSYILSAKADTGKSPLTKAAARGHTEVVKMLLKKLNLSTEINDQDTKLRHTPLHLAAINGSKEIVELLLEHGARTDAIDKRGNTPFKACFKHWAQSASNDSTEVLLLLIDKEPLDVLRDPELVNVAAIKGSVPILTKLLDKGASLSQTDEHGWTPLQLASQYGHLKAVKFLSERGAVTGRKPTGWTCAAPTVKISDDRTVVEYIAEDRNETGVLSDHPIPAGVKRYYYEISITEPGGKKTDPILGLGLCNAPSKITDWMPGWANKTAGGAPSWGYHGDDGCLFTDKIKSKVFSDMRFATYGHGDVMGCAVDFEKGEVFYTRNGEKLQTAFREVRGRLHPVVGMGQHVSVKVNFGEDVERNPFVWEKANTTLGIGWLD